MKGILILAHGSKRKETEESLAAVVEMLRGELPVGEGIGAVESAFLQFSDRTLQWGLRALEDQGIDDITVMPYFLFAGVHINEDIPREIEEFTRENPHIRVHMGRTLGPDKRLALILRDRIMEMMA